MQKDLQIVGFQIGQETYGLPVSVVREIIRVPVITTVPHAPEHIEGVINLRGQILPVMDLRKRFGASVPERAEKSRIVVVELDARPIGLVVNSASEVLRIPQSEIEQPEQCFPEGEPDYVSGVGKLSGRLLILLDLRKLLEPPDRREALNAPGRLGTAAASSESRTS